MKRVFADSLDEVASDGMAVRTLVKHDELMAVVSAYSSSVCGYPDESPAVFHDILHEVVWHTVFHIDCGKSMLVGPPCRQGGRECGAEQQEQEENRGFHFHYVF